jgi:16S rRNA (adenine1518-N6/adenine1519-N6)-dimethyltransferase
VHRARKSLGQNFLVDPNLQRRIAAALDLSPDDEVLEIGPGLGAITRIIAGSVRSFVAVEIDPRLADRLRSDFASVPGTSILNQDILELDLASVCTSTDRLKVIGNIPYNITTPILFHLLERRSRPAALVIMLQREVADRILAPAATSAYGALSVAVRVASRVERLFHVRRTAFRPVPNVDSTVIRITPIRPFPLSPLQESDLRTLTRSAFSWRRKQLQRTLRDSPRFRLASDDIARLQHATGFDLTRRVETFDPDHLVLLSTHLRQIGRPLPDRDAR